MLRFEATLVCEGCGIKRVNLVTDEDIHRLKRGDFLKLICSECHTVTDWGLLAEDRREMPDRRKTPTRRAGEDKRRYGRVRLHLPIEVRHSVGGMEFAENTTTVNISRSGIYFLTDRDLRWGMKIMVVLPHALVPDPKNPALEGRIVRIDPRSEAPRFGVAVHFEGITLEI